MNKFTKLIPLSLRKSIRPLSNKIRSIVRRLLRTQMDRSTLGDLKADLASAGFSVGDILMVHSAMSKVGNVDGGAETIVKSFLETVERSGTILMPAYGAAGEVEEGMKTGSIIDLRTQKSYMGKITEVFRTWTGVKRSSHPFSSVCAIGNDTETMLADHWKNPNISHIDSPLGRIVEKDAQIVGIGVSIAVGMAVSHVLEDTDETFPIEVHSPAFKAKYVDSNGGSVIRDIIRFDPEVSKTRIGSPNTEWINEMLTKHFTKLGTMRHFRFGNADSWVMNAAPVFEELKRLAKLGITIYLTETQWKTMNGGDPSIDSWLARG
ncbi:MAG: AAC(3) family N-acetyltransferase [Candidatus Marinimicrobia bacterium]|jgi:aminoglycoside N3'-acetyltransferase|nr:AAC(3) family N-acetyltransferase [Candidatus Neomarinimicrobiota bacterium]MBT3950405.1 AAC(3) family N-acetyltransferase [Candidatus Neomarinimicrobiota bacterium]MBT4481076.1 AAC(3) family N-acetyltransferase [Candidatus Neomarinimicrobiota bacterium]MBT5233693.1 AAC(3) family N-acetyltransferase [Candidatus Neomarinimicrobiota bacterium]MBT6720434.1 AAC(3) family N-acetyltransferase [Candidatus Neomarinimicrobiota bacterium]